MLCIFISRYYDRSECVVLPWCPVAHWPSRPLPSYDVTRWPAQSGPPSCWAFLTCHVRSRVQVRRSATCHVHSRVQRTHIYLGNMQKHPLAWRKQNLILFVQNWWKQTEELFLCLAQSVPIVMISTLVWWSWLMEPNIKMTKRFLLCVHTLFCYILFPWADVGLLGCNIPYSP